MRRLAAGLVFTVLASPTVRADDPPPLEPPLVLPPLTEAPGELPPKLEARPLPGTDHRPMLVIPGVNTPRANSRLRSTPTAPVPPPPGELPPLVGPSESGPANAPAAGRTAPRWAELRDDTRAAPIQLEPASPDGPSARPSTGAKLRDRPPVTAVPPPRRPSGFFGRFLPQPGPGTRGASARENPVKVEPRTNPAADAVLKRRVEKQIREELGPRLRTYEVRVVGSEVVIRAQSVRFWQRNSVRTALKALPALNGYKSTVLVDE